MRKLRLSLLLSAAVVSGAHGQGLSNGNGISHVPGGGGGGAITSISTSCPASGPSIGAVTVSGYLGGRAVSGGTDTLATTDCGSYVRYQNATSTAVTVPSAASLGAGWSAQITVDSGAGTVTLTGTSNFNTTGSTTLTAAAGQSIGLSSDGTTILVYPGKSSGGGATGANPTATASNSAVNGSATTFMRSDAAPAVQLATTGQFGLVKPDGSTITISGGVISSTGGGSGTLTVGTTATSGGAAGQVMYDTGSVLTESAGFTYSSGALSLSAAGTLGSLQMGNATSGTVTVQPVTGALGTVTASLPANTGTIAETNLAQTFSAVQTFSSTPVFSSNAASFTASGTTNGTVSGQFKNSNTGNAALYQIQLGNNIATAESSFSIYGGSYATAALQSALVINDAVSRIEFSGTSAADLGDYGITTASAWTMNGPVKLSGGYTVATLPSGVIGQIAYVTDAVTCTFLASLTGGGTTYCPVSYNGSAWLGG